MVCSLPGKSKGEEHDRTSCPGIELSRKSLDNKKWETPACIYTGGQAARGGRRPAPGEGLGDKVVISRPLLNDGNHLAAVLAITLPNWMLPIATSDQNHSISVAIETSINDIRSTRELHQILREIRAYTI